MKFSPEQALSRLKSFFSAKDRKFGEATISSSSAGVAEGTVVRFPGEEPVVGDPLTAVAADGSEARAPAGEHTLEDGRVIVTDDAGNIVEIRPAAADVANAAKLEAEKAHAKLAELEAKMAEKEAEQKALLHLMRTQPAAQPAAAGHGSESRFMPLHKASGNYSVEEILQFRRALRQSRSQDKEFAKQAGIVKRGGTYDEAFAASPSAITSRALQYMEEVLSQEIPLDNILSQFSRIPLPISKRQSANAPAQVTLDIPRLALSSIGYVKDTMACDFTSAGTASPTLRKLDAFAARFEHQICARTLRGQLNGTYYLGDDRVPAEAVYLDLVSNLLDQDMERQIFAGNRGGTDFIEGINGNLNTDSDRTAGIADNSLRLSWTGGTAYSATTAVARVEALCDLVPNNMRRKPLLYFIPVRDLDLYLRNYRNTYGAVVWNNGYLKSAPDTAMDVTFIPVFAFTDRHLLTGADNVFYAYENFQFRSVVLPDLTDNIRIKQELQFGVNYGFGTEFFEAIKS